MHATAIAKTRDQGQAVRLLLALVGFIVVGWGVGAICRSALTGVDLRIVQDIASGRSAAQITASNVFSFIGSGYIVFPLAALCCVILYLRRRQWQSLAVGVSTLGATVIANVDKVLVGRPRPPVEHLEAVTGQSFPSGHTAHTAAFCMALVLTFYAAHPPRPLRIAALIGGSLIVLAVAASRVYLGVHYPSDVVAAALLGATWSIVVARIVSETGRPRSQHGDDVRGDFAGAARPHASTAVANDRQARASSRTQGVEDDREIDPLL
jgi:membrane-associated phospholipid phosphatase